MSCVVTISVGTKQDPGVSCRAITTLFEQFEARTHTTGYTCKMEVMQLYNDTLTDLLAPPSASEFVTVSSGSSQYHASSSKRLDIRQGSEGVYVSGLTSVTLSR